MSVIHMRYVRIFEECHETSHTSTSFFPVQYSVEIQVDEMALKLV